MTTQADVQSGGIEARSILGVLRLATGWLFLWSFLDSLLGLGFSTCRSPEDGSIDVMCDAAFLSGGSPTWGFLNFNANAHTAGLVDWMAPSAPDAINFADILYMLGMFGVGIGLTCGIALRLAGIGGALMMSLVYLASYVWPEFNPFINENVIYAIICILIAVAPNEVSAFSLRDKWMAMPVVEKYPVLR